MECTYCFETATKIHNSEELCDRHFKILCPEQSKTNQLQEVPKSYREKRLNKRYTKRLTNCKNDEEFQQIIIDFKADLAIVEKQSRYYKNRDKIK